MKPQKIHGPGTAVKFLGVVRSGKIYIVSETIVDKIQAYLIPKTMKQVQAFMRILGYW